MKKIVSSEAAVMVGYLEIWGIEALTDTLKKKDMMSVRKVCDGWRSGNAVLFSKSGPVDPAKVKIAAAELISLDDAKALPSAAEVEALVTQLVQHSQDRYQNSLESAMLKVKEALGGPDNGPHIISGQTLMRYVPAY